MMTIATPPPSLTVIIPAFNEALPEEPLEVATAKALREALGAAAAFSGAAATSADLQLAELIAEIEARDGAPVCTTFLAAGGAFAVLGA